MQPYMNDLWTLKAITKEAKKYNSRAEFETHSSNAYRVAWANGLLPDICKHMDIGRRAIFVAPNKSYTVRHFGNIIKPYKRK